MMTLRFATPQDAKQILDIYAPYITDTSITFEYDIPPLDQFTERIVNITRRLPWLVCEEDGQIIGYSYASPHLTRAAYQWDAELSVYTRQGHHRKGVGRKMYSALISLLREQGYYNLYALVTLPNEKSMGFHHSMGFSTVGIYPRTGFKLGAWCDMAILELALHEEFGTPAPLKTVHELTPEQIETALHPEPCLIGAK
jgi:phosphinothricin acetyltransferase